MLKQPCRLPDQRPPLAEELTDKRQDRYALRSKAP